MNNATFHYNYSAEENRELQEIRSRYLPREENKIEELKRLDLQVQTAGIIHALTVGISGFLLFALGICLTVRVIGESIVWIPFGILLLLIGAAGIGIAYPIHRKIFRKTKEKLTPRILELAEELSK